MKKQTQLAIGDKAPNFNLLNRQGNEMNLGDFKQKYKILSIFPAINTKVCDLQTSTFFNKVKNSDNVVILNISKDSVEIQNEWCLAKKFDNIITLSAINNIEFAIDYALETAFKNLLKRAVFILDKNNKIIYVEYVKHITNPINFEEIDIQLKKLQII